MKEKKEIKKEGNTPGFSCQGFFSEVCSLMCTFKKGREVSDSSKHKAQSMTALSAVDNFRMSRN